MKRIPTVRIAIAIRLDHASWRDFLGGFLSAIRRYPHWSLSIVSPADIGAVDESCDGLVIGDIDESAAKRLATSTRPLVVVGSQSTSISSRRRNVVFLHNDDEDIGRCGAEALAALGDRNSLGFVPTPGGAHWSDLRERGFRSALSREDARRVSVYRAPRGTGVDDDRRFRRWLTSLAKPAAVMAAYDALAVRTIEACREAGIDVPNQVAVLGVDNDKLLCETSRPALSSVAPDHFHEGELAAEAMADLLLRPLKRPKTILCTRKSVVARESTAPAKPAAALLRKALSFIAENADRRITARDVAAALGVSRQLVDLRFREFGERTLAATIRDERLKSVRKLLKNSQLPIGTVARNCGWANVKHLENAFRRRFGMSMRDFRNRQTSRPIPSSSRV